MKFSDIVEQLRKSEIKFYSNEYVLSDDFQEMISIHENYIKIAQEQKKDVKTDIQCVKAKRLLKGFLNSINEIEKL